MSLKTVSGFLAAAVADAGTFTVAFPTGTTRGNFAPLGVNHRLVMNQVELQSPNKITLAFTTLVTITNKTGATWPIGSPFVLQLETTGEANGRVSTLGVPMPAVTDCPLSWVDLGTPIATVATNLRAAAAVAGAGALVLLITTLDVPRNLIITSAGNDTGITFTVVGKDVYGQAMTEVITGANAGVAAGKKAWSTITSITASGASAGNVSIGVGNVLGIPVFIPGAAVIVKESQDGAVATAGTLVAGDQTFPSTTTGDVRGTYVPNAAPDASKAYALICALPDPRYLGATNV
jgi:hypothetical protein